jgi:hypothetical protein
VLDDSEGLGTIADNDTSSITVQDIFVTEGNSGVSAATFMVSLSVPNSRDVSVNFATQPLSASATTGVDYVARSGAVVFPAGTTGPIPVIVDVYGDVADEVNEAFSLALLGATNATIGRSLARATILDDDDPPVFSVSDASVVEGDGGSRVLVFTISLSTASGIRTRVRYETVDGTAVAGADYAARTGEVVLEPGFTTATISVPVTGETVLESSETLFLNLFTPTSATIEDAQGVGTIVDDDGGT